MKADHYVNQVGMFATGAQTIKEELGAVLSSAVFHDEIMAKRAQWLIGHLARHVQSAEALAKDFYEASAHEECVRARRELRKLLRASSLESRGA